MARIRSVKPEMRRSRTVALWPREVRYAFVLLFGYLDDEGRGEDDMDLLKADLFPRDKDVTERKLDGWLWLIAEADPADPTLCRYEVDGRQYLHAPKWKAHQKINRPQPSRIPPCPVHDGGKAGSLRHHGAVREPAVPAHAPLTESSVNAHVHSTEGSLHARKDQGSGIRDQGSGDSASPATACGAEVIPIGAATAVTAQTLVGEWLDHCASRPPGRVVGQTSKELRALLAEGMPEDAIRRGLADWHRRGQHPSTLPSFVNAAMNAAGPGLPARPRSTTDDRVAAGLEMVAKYAALERGDAG